MGLLYHCGGPSLTLRSTSEEVLLRSARRRMKTDPKKAAGRAFVRSLNILLKFARLYGYEHARTIEQLQTAWQELRTAIPMGTDSGLLLGATNSQLLLDGVPLEGSPAEKQFAQLLSAAGLAKRTVFRFGHGRRDWPIRARFSHRQSQTRRACPAIESHPRGRTGIHINEIYFVATDARLKDASMAAQIAAASLGGDQEEFRQWLNDPQKLLELIAAAQGSKSGGVSGPGPGGPVPAGGASGAGDSGAAGGRSRRDKHWDWAGYRFLDCRQYGSRFRAAVQRRSWLFWADR